MSNPQISHHTIDTATIYNYSQHKNIPWNMTEYHTPKTEVDVELQIKKRKWKSQKKAQKDGRYLTKRGFYMDYDLKIAKSVPSTHAHGQQKEWDFSNQKKISLYRKVDQKLTKNSFLQKIQIDQKKRKIPGVCTYSLQKSIKQKDKQVEQMKRKPPKKIGQKIFYHQNTQFLSSEVPGIGNYSLRLNFANAKQKSSKQDHNFWIKKHRIQTEAVRQRDSKIPGPATHSPMNTSMVTFDQLAIQFQQPTKKHCFGTDAKFQYTRQNKKKIVQKRCDLLSHSLTYQWKGKGISPKKTKWNEIIYKGPSQTVYH